ncbi:MAG: helix-turn-helix domain-containing protein [Lachnospiraceae bacterium]|nr:helix-turn-helix domain-containing protein [Lachnospiraceae bacterium]
MKETKDLIRAIREETGMNRKEFSEHLGIPLRTIEDWEAGRRNPPEYVPRLIKYQIAYEKLMGEKQNE